MNLAGIDGADKLIPILGASPSFHDSEILRIDLSRENCVLNVTLYVFAVDREILDERGCFKRLNESLITLQFDAVSDVEIENFNEQNVVMELLFRDRGRDGFEIELVPSYGAYLKFRCNAIRVADIDQ